MEFNTGSTQQGLYFNQPTWIGCPSCSCWVLYDKHAANGILTCQTCRNSSDEDEMNSFLISPGGANWSWPAFPPQKDTTSQRPFKVGSQAASGGSVQLVGNEKDPCLNNEVADESRPNQLGLYFNQPTWIGCPSCSCWVLYDKHVVNRILTYESRPNQQGLYFNQPTWIGCPSCSCWVLYDKHAANGILTCQTCRNSSDEDEMNYFQISPGGANWSWPAFPPWKDATSQLAFKVGSQAASGGSMQLVGNERDPCLNEEVADESRPNQQGLYFNQPTWIGCPSCSCWVLYDKHAANGILTYERRPNQQGLHFNQPTWIGCPSCSCWVLYDKHAANGILTCQTCRNSSDEDEMNSFRISPGGANWSWRAFPPQKDATSQRLFKVGSQAASGGSIQLVGNEKDPCLNKEVADESGPDKNTEHMDAKINKHGRRDSSKRNSKKRKMASESSESCDTLDDDGNNLTGNNLGGFGKRYPRRYIRSKMCVSCSEPLNPSCNGAPVSVEIPESEFYNFDADKSKEKIQVGQIWAVYSDEDALPKYYCQIKKIDSLPENTYHVAWLLHCPSSRDMVRWVDKSIPICCGTFMVEKGKTHKIVGTLPFSHQLKIEPSPLEKEDVFTILPEVGQIWACYENWNVKMKLSELENCKYEILEILDVDDISIVAAPLELVCGYKSVFKSRVGEKGIGVKPMTILLTEILKFSHQIPAFCLKDKQGGSLPDGSYELDSAAVPQYLLCPS